ncbi:MAG: hypothetical protein GQ531_02450 [Sulfurovum sp.]|nr:hypothetical protein [Sulfurovum sp.]
MLEIYTSVGVAIAIVIQSRFSMSLQTYTQIAQPLHLSSSTQEVLASLSNISVFASGQYNVQVLHLYSAHLSESTFAT